MAATPPPDFTSTAFNSSVIALVQSKTYNWIGDINASFVLQSGYLVFMSNYPPLLSHKSMNGSVSCTAALHLDSILAYPSSSGAAGLPHLRSAVLPCSAAWICSGKPWRSLCSSCVQEACLQVLSDASMVTGCAK